MDRLKVLTAVAQSLMAGHSMFGCTCRLNSFYVPHESSNDGPGMLSRYSDSLRAGQSWNRISLGGEIFHTRQTVRGAHPASYTMGTSSFLGVKRPVLGVDDPPPSYRRS
jgi:hypothetical protein